MSILQALLDKHPIRKTKAQKQAFREWAVQTCTDMGYTACAEEKGYSRNIIIGNPETAQVIFTAHYDTQPRMFFPNMCTPTKPAIFLLYQIGMGIGIVAVGALLGLLTGFVFHSFWVGYILSLAATLALCFLIMFGPANPSCANDNTSGVAAVLELMARIPAQQREKAAFILFDNEEKGLLGSSVYAGKHKEIKKHKLLINMDCVGDGENILFFANKATRALPCFSKLTEAMEAQQGRNYLMNKLEKCIYPSDQNNYKLGVAVCACSYKPSLGYYFSKIHTVKDTVCDQENLDFLANGLAQFVEKL